MAESKIEWTTYTFSPWIGCAHVKEARECDACYAEQYAKRFLADEKLWGNNADRHFTSEGYWQKPLSWDRKAKLAGRREYVFCASLSDWAEDRPDLAEKRQRLFRLIESTPNLIWQLLTKRYENALELLSIWEKYGSDEHKRKNGPGLPENIILGFTTGTNMTTRLARIAIDKKNDFGMPKVKLFLSAEPLLEETSFELMQLIGLYKPDQIICGGESGTKARPMSKYWVEQMLEQCQIHNIPFLFKQWGEWMPYSETTTEQKEMLKGRVEMYVNPKEPKEIYYKLGKHNTGRLLNGREYNGMPSFELNTVF
jgi:protein gp37